MKSNARRKSPRLFSYSVPWRARRTLRVLTARHGAEVKFHLELQPDFRYYIRAVRRDGRTGLVAKRPLVEILG
jgi:hypothetical protein